MMFVRLSQKEDFYVGQILKLVDDIFPDCYRKVIKITDYGIEGKECDISGVVHNVLMQTSASWDMINNGLYEGVVNINFDEVKSEDFL